MPDVKPAPMRASTPRRDGRGRASHRNPTDLSQVDVRLGPLSTIPALLRDLGHDPAPVLERCGLAPDGFDHPEQRLPYRQAGAVFEDAALTSGREDFGLLVGQRFEIEHFGLLGRLLWRAATIGGALHDLYRYFHLQDRGGVVYLRQREGSVVALGYSIVDADTPGAALVHDLVMAIALRLMRGLAGAGFAPREVRLSRARPANLQPYRRFFAAPLRFDAAQSELHFDRFWLQQIVAGADPADHAAARRVARSLEADVLPGMAGRARAAAHVLLADGTLSAPNLADALGMHERTLRRRLADEGKNIKDIVAAARFELSKQLLRDTQLPVERIAAALGYSDPSAFVRAFRTWSALTPGGWRATCRADPAPPAPWTRRPRGRQSAPGDAGLPPAPRSPR